MKMCDITKRSKKEQKEFYKSQRVINGFNTGTRTMKTDKNPSRARRKELDRKEMEEWDTKFLKIYTH